MHHSPGFRIVPLLAALLAVALCPAAQAQLGSGDLRGRAPDVIDSGLIDLAGRPVYLYGLRGLRRDETCKQPSDHGGRDHGGVRQWDCGQEAWWAARNRIASHWVDCVERGRGPGGEIFAVCYLGGVGGPELNGWLVEQGWARAASDYAQDYVDAENAARAAGRGIWRGQ